MLAAGCGGRCRTSLLVADSLSDVDGQQAMAVLDSLRPHMDDASRRERMLYELARLKAQNMMYQLPASDSVVRPLLDYYESSGDDRHKADIYYITGKVYRKMNDYPRAMDCFFRIIDTTPQEYFDIRGRAYGQLGYMFSYQNLTKDALEMFIHALQCYKDAKDTVSMVFTTRDIGNQYVDLGVVDKARCYFEGALRLALKIKSEDLSASVSVQLAHSYYAKGDYWHARKCIQRALDYNDEYDKVAVQSVLADIYEGLGFKDSAYVCYRQMEKEDKVSARCSAYRGLSEYYAGKDAQKEIYYSRKYANCVDTMNSLMAADVVKQEYNRYNYKLLERDNKQLQVENANKKFLIAVLVSAVVVLSLFVLSWVLFARSKKERSKRKTWQELFFNLFTSFGNKDEQNRAVVEDFAIYAKLKSLHHLPVSQKRLSEKDWRDLAAAINKEYEGFDKRLGDLCEMNTVDYRVCLLLKKNVPLVDIAYVINQTSSGVGSIRRKLFERTFKRKAPAKEWDDVIRLL